MDLSLSKKQTEAVLCKFLTKESGLNEVLEMMLNALMQIERSVHLSNDLGNKGNGYRLGRVFGYGKQIELRIPRDRSSAFYPTILALFRDQDAYLKEVSFQLYSKGLTTRDISDVMETIYGNHYSKSTISAINQTFYNHMESWRNRALESHYKAIYIDGLHVKLKRDGRYQNECFYIILGMKEDNKREVLSIVNFPSESATGWQSVLEELKTRGVYSVGLIVSDNLTGLDSAITKVFGPVPQQRCIVHLQRNLSKYVRREDRTLLAQDLRDVLSPDDPSHTKEKAINRLKTMANNWGKKYRALEKHLLGSDFYNYFTYLDYHVKVRRMIYTTNWIERFNRSARRTLKIRGALPNEESVLALITSTAIEKSEKQYGKAVYQFDYEPKLTK